jgi:hypothetical protein
MILPSILLVQGERFKDKPASPSRVYPGALLVAGLTVLLPQSRHADVAVEMAIP